MPEDVSNPYDLKRLQDRVQPIELKHTKVTASTNDWAKQEVESGAVRPPALLVADSQSAGRGRGTNTWWSAIGNITATFIVSQNPHVAFGLVPLFAGLAVRRALVRATACEEISLKWPNDLVVGDRKAVGLLCERLKQVDLIGVGVNANAGREEAPEELEGRITSLRELTCEAVDLASVLGEIGQELNRVLTLASEDDAREMLEEYTRHHWPTGKDIELIDTDDAPRISGRCMGIDLQGRLLVKTEQGVRSFFTGSILSVTPVTE
jgi:BirA family biotin operon repressor/biotin-[acetyl-CoA-carboxylase] ligase